MLGIINIITISLLIISCKKTIEQPNFPEGNTEAPGIIINTEKLQIPFDTIIVPFDVSMSCYFDYMDSLVSEYDSLVSYAISEHLIVRTQSLDY